MNGRMELKNLLVVIPHGGTVLPAEVPVPSVSENFADLAANIDWYTQSLYDFRDLLGNAQAVFQFCPLVLEANRHPGSIDDCVPLADIHGEPLYKPGTEPGPELRAAMAAKYLVPFHNSITERIVSGAQFLLDGHSTVTARGVAADQIELMNFQQVPSDQEPQFFSPDCYIETYAEELRRLLPDARVTVNTSDYFNVYGHICAAHSINAMKREGSRVPAVLQETNQSLYMNSDRTVDIAKLERLRRAFAAALFYTLNEVK